MPDIILLAGPNGAGKTTISARVVRRGFTFLNADVIAAGMIAAGAANADIAAGRQLLARWDELAASRSNFVIETTLATRTFARRITNMRTIGYRFYLIYVWVSSSDIAVNRVRERVLNGGHAIPEDVSRRRYQAGIRSFFEVYQPIADTWIMYDNSGDVGPQIIARGRVRIEMDETWNQIRQQVRQ